MPVAPGEELVQTREIVIRTFRIADQVRDALLQVFVSAVKLCAENLRCPLDLLWIAADLFAPFIEDPVLPTQNLRLSLTIPHRGVLGDNAERHLLAASADQNWQCAMDR